VAPLNFTRTSSDAWGDVENSGELFGKPQSTTPRNHGHLIIAVVAFAQVEVESGQGE